MARTLFVIAPNGLATPTIDLIDPANDQIEETITLTESNNWKGRYVGTLTTLVAALYGAVLRSAGTVVGSYAYCRVTAVEPEVAEVSDSVGVHDAPRYNDQYKMTSQDDDEIFVLLTDEKAP